MSTAGGREFEGTRSAAVPRLWLVGYGEWTGFALKDDRSAAAAV